MVKLYCDSGDLKQMSAIATQVSGFTSNPTLMRKAGVTDYLAFAREAVLLGKPISFEVFADDYEEMYRQAHVLAELGEQVYVKIPVVNTRGLSQGKLIGKLCREGVNVNATAVFTINQVITLARVMNKGPAIVSIFAGRIADTGLSPSLLVRRARHLCYGNIDILWASTRQLYSIQEAEQAGADIITIAPDMLAKMGLFGKDLRKYSRETVQMFYDDAKASGYVL